jgi:hypothetical protein
MGSTGLGVDEGLGRRHVRVLGDVTSGCWGMGPGEGGIGQRENRWWARRAWNGLIR